MDTRYKIEIKYEESSFIKKTNAMLAIANKTVLCSKYGPQIVPYVEGGKYIFCFQCTNKDLNRLYLIIIKAL